MDLNTETLKALAHVASKDETPYTGMTGVQITSNSHTVYTATDGHILVQVDHGKTLEDDSHDPVVIQGATIKRMKVRDYHELTHSLTDSTLRTSGSHEATETIPDSTSYPDVARVVKSAAALDTVVRFGLTPDVILKLAKATVGLKMTEIVVEIAEPLDPIRISGTDGDGHPVSGLLMPRRLEDKT